MAEPLALLESVKGFDWDVANFEKNWKRHRVTQAEAEQVFANLPLLAVATTEARGEARWFALGHTDGSTEIAVVFTVRRQGIRVIWARPMSRRERKEYTHAQGTATAAKADS